VSGNAQSMVAGVVTPGAKPLPYKATKEFPALGYPDSTDDVRGGMGITGLMNLYKFVEDGGTLITEGATSSLFPEYNLTPGVTVDQPGDLFARGTIVRGMITDLKSPITYGFTEREMAVYFSQGPILNVSAGGAGGFGGFGGGGGRGAPVGQNTQPMASAPVVSSITVGGMDVTPPGAEGGARGGRGGRGAGFGGGRGGRGGRGGETVEGPRVIMRFPGDTTQMLLSGGLANAGVLENKAQLVDTPVGKGHVVSFAIRPYWRWQTQGTYSLGFNAIMNWNDLDAGRARTTP
jgi:hypothetical protein